MLYNDETSGPPPPVPSTSSLCRIAGGHDGGRMRECVSHVRFLESL
jgi:hypothetical protein